MNISNWVKSKFNIGDKEDRCRAVIDEDTGEICGNRAWGRGCSDGYEIKYCKEDNHVPSDATPWGGRMEPLKFYIPEDDTIVEIK